MEYNTKVCFSVTMIVRIMKPYIVILDMLQAHMNIISAFVFAIRTIPLLPNVKLISSGHLLWLYSPVCVGSGRHPHGATQPTCAPTEASLKNMKKCLNEVQNEQNLLEF